MKNHGLMAMRFVLVCLTPLSLSLPAHASNSIDAATLQKFDAVFSDFSVPRPALAVAMFKNRELVYQKAYGQANLEHGIPATVDTSFQVDTLAWEFIAYSALMLESQGKIKLSDDIRKYLPELPDLGEKITVNHLLSSTDGVAGYKVLQALAGWEASGSGQNAAVLDLIKSQKTLNFKPGEEFSPGGDSRFILLARIVEVVSGESFDAFSKKNIFTPLGMANTQFVVDDAQFMANRAVPYRSAGEGVYKHDVGGRNTPGLVNLYSSIRDLSLWRASLASPAPGNQALADKLNQPIKLDSGVVIRDIARVSTYGQQHAGQERGISKKYQIGGVGGYASSVFSFPDHDVSVVVLSSGLDYSGSYGMRLASVLLEKQFVEPLTIDYSRIQRVKVAPSQLAQYAGNYWTAVRAVPAVIYVKDDVLYYGRAGGAPGRELIPLGGAKFQLKIEGDDHYFVEFVGGKHGPEMHYRMGTSDPVVFESYKPVSYTDRELEQFAGTFHNEELNASYVLTVSKGMLSARNLRVGQVDFKPLDANRFSGNKPFMGGLRFQRGSNQEVTGFQIIGDEARGLQFKKIHGPGA
ncbi:serine hydrolase [Massilia sp. CFBP9012]|uniref:serine hydrolase domain-containing protein n=1 Tax=Massilia sp. CFBP9012 TaxID=3096531 RepID=UPI002A6A9C47|nr:serine hydrolase [Massilia sp. CFBP9012]MDY0978426.1 serine hydrolase [Massilia sp. CFBP9012]